MKHIIVLLMALFAFGSSSVFAQTVSEQRMQRQIEQADAATKFAQQFVQNMTDIEPCTANQETVVDDSRARADARIQYQDVPRHQNRLDVQDNRYGWRGLGGQGPDYRIDTLVEKERIQVCITKPK